MEATNISEMPTSFTLSQFSSYVTGAIARDPVLRGAWVTAEISDLSNSGGHCYMTLIEKDPSGTTIARMRATIWANRFAYLRRKFLDSTGRELSNGMKVMLFGSANHHPAYGLSFNIGEIDPSYTMGDLERIRQEILAALRREGIIDQNKMRPVNMPPQRIAIISSEKAAGYGDFVSQLENNSAGAVFYTLLFPAMMQGERTASTVIEALDLVEQTSGLVGWDCVAIIRGGGATTDMNGFDNLELARRIATFPIPVAVGIGHERDRCVLDEIACIRCKTPTAVAAWLSDTAAMAWQRAADLAQRAATYSTQRLKGEEIRLHQLTSRLPLAAGESIAAARTRLEGIATTLRLSALSRMEKENSRLDNLGKLIAVLSPTATLKRGYTITRIGGKAIYGASGAVPGEIMETVTAEGSIFSKIETVEGGEVVDIRKND